jgi:hypothetical protein
MCVVAEMPHLVQLQGRRVNIVPMTPAPLLTLCMEAAVTLDAQQPVHAEPLGKMDWKHLIKAMPKVLHTYACSSESKAQTSCTQLLPNLHLSTPQERGVLTSTRYNAINVGCMRQLKTLLLWVQSAQLARCSICSCSA